MPFAVFNDKKLVDYGVYSIKEDFLEDKIAFAYHKIKELITQYNIDVLILEDVYINLNPNGSKSSIQVMGAMRLGAHELNVPCFTVMASKWRKGVIKGRKRAEKKKLAVEYVNENYGLDLKYFSSRTKTDDDIAEVIIMVEGLVWERYTLDDVQMFNAGKDGK